MGPFFLTPTPKIPRSFILGLKVMPVAGSVMAALAQFSRNKPRRRDSECMLEGYNGLNRSKERLSHGSGSRTGSGTNTSNNQDTTSVSIRK